MKLRSTSACRVLIAGSLFSLAACGSKEDPPIARGESSPRRTDVSQIRLTESIDPTAGLSCTNPATRTGDYELFIEKAAAYGHPIPGETLDAQIKALDEGAVPLETKRLSGAELAARIVQGLNIEFLLNTIDEGPLEVRTTAVHTEHSAVERDLVFVSPWVGSFGGILLMPEGPGPFPAVIAIHGHPDDAAIYRDDFHGSDFPRHGYAILMLTMRAMAIDEAEHKISMDLLRAGFALVGMRVYETLLALKLLRFLAAKDGEIDSDRIGLIGHSGGSSACDLTVRIEPRFKAYVSDNSVNWHRSDGPWEKFTGKLEPIHCETVPALFPINEQIRDFSSCTTPVFKVAYGSAKSQSGNDRIIRFCDGTLKK